MKRATVSGMSIVRGDTWACVASLRSLLLLHFLTGRGSDRDLDDCAWEPERACAAAAAAADARGARRRPRFLLRQRDGLGREAVVAAR